MLKFGLKAQRSGMGLVASATLAALALPGDAATAQEFDCRNAVLASERTICRNDDLSALDEQMSGLYTELMDTHSSRGQRDDLRRYQRRFLAARDACGRDVRCIKGAYLDQISVLEARLERAYRRSER